MWIVPEFVYYDELDEMITLPLPDELPTKEDDEIIYISQEKILEFARILNEAIDTRAIEAIPFIERILLGMYAFTYESKDDGAEEYLSTDTLRQLLDYCKKKFFSGEMIPPYDENDIKHIIEYYAQKETCPQFYTFTQVDREKLDVSTVANDIWAEDMGKRAKANYLNELWNNGDKNI